VGSARRVLTISPAAFLCAEGSEDPFPLLTYDKITTSISKKPSPAYRAGAFGKYVGSGIGLPTGGHVE